MSNQEAELAHRMSVALTSAGQPASQATDWLKQYTKSILRQYMFTSGDRSLTMEGRFFRSEGASVYDENFDFAASLRVSGDFVDGEANQYAAMIADALNKVSQGDL